MSIAWRPARRSALSARDSAELYETPSCAIRALIEIGELNRFRNGVIWEPCSGRGAIVRELKAKGFHVVASDLIDYDGADPGIETPRDFLQEKAPAGVSSIVSNFPYGQSDRFIRHGLGLDLTTILLSPWQRAEGKGRRDLIDGHLQRVWLFRERLPTLHREGWAGPRTKRAGLPYGWFVFEPKPKTNPSFTVTCINWSLS